MVNQKCRRIVEIGGLAVVLFLPLCFNPFATTPFEPAKVALFRGITVGMVMALTASSLLNHRNRSLSARFRCWIGPLGLSANNPLALFVLIYAAAYTLATVTSIDSRLSLWGSSDNPQGTITVLSAVVFFLLMADALRTKEQLDRIVKALLLGSVPVAGYGLVQYLGLDPLDWITDSVSPVLSTMGRSNFLGAYLAMVIPFTLSRIVIGQGAGWSWRYALVLTLQITCLLLTLARGAWLGFLGGSLTFLWLLARRWRSRVLLAIFVTVLVIGSWLFASMNSSDVALAQLAADRTGNLPEGSGPSFSQLRAASVGARITIWKRTLDLIPPRWFLGYGPETFAAVFSLHYPPELARFEGPNVVVDDPHNLILDQVMAAGIVGLLAFLGIIATFYRTTLGAFRRETDRRTQATVAAILGSATAFLIQAQFNPDVIVLSVLFWLVMALGVVVHRWGKPASQIAIPYHTCTKIASRPAGG
jgi:putative inorganic carbon (HCO3(-)) transporter